MPNLDMLPQDDFDGVDRKALSAVRHRFMKINEARLQRAMSVLNNYQQAFLEALPVLLHVNHALLPGYVSNSTPCGVSSFEPEKRHIRATKSIANAFSYQPKNDPPAIHNISVMGSVGTVAHSRQSDMDFWVCYDSRLTDEALAELETKLTGIQRWAEGLGLEVYFFLMNAEQFRQGQRRGVSGEDCGSAQHYLLLDEYYRTGLIVAGRPPAWWVVPSEHEKNYDDFLKKLYKAGEVKPYEFIDFGGIPVFPAGEFIGAGMWQLYKGVESPYKSVLKIMLTEVYASEYPSVKGLSLLFKSAIYDGEMDLDVLDPYIMLYRKLEQYLKGRKESDRLDLLRKCLYFKINEIMSRPSKGTSNWKRKALQQLIDEWHWGVPLIYLLDNRKNWKVQQVVDQRKILVDELNFSYRFLSRFARDNGFSALINDQDMSLLGRKLYAAFERKSGKVEHINPNIAPNITEEHLTILREFNAGKNGLKVGTWAVFSGALKQAEKDEVEPIKRGRSIVEILTWCYFNHIIDSATRFTLYAGDTDLTEHEIRQVLGSMSSLYPERLEMASQESFHYAARPKHMSLIVNVGIDPMAEMNRKGYQRITEQTDALNFSGLHENLVVSIDQVTKNTWHEVMMTHFDREQSVVDCVVDFMRSHTPGKYGEMPKINISCFSPTRPQAICQRLEDLFEGILETYYRQKHRLETRYILSVGSKYFIFQFRNKQPLVKSVASLSGLMRYLSAPQKEFSPIIFDAYAHPRDPLPFLARKNAPGVVQVFYRKLETKTTFYIFDEKGSLVTFHEDDIQEKPFLRKLGRFFKSVEGRRQQSGAVDADQKKVRTSFAEIIQGNPFALELRTVSASIEDERYHNIEVIVERSFDGEQYYTIFCDHQEFSEYKYGDRIFKAVALHILKRRKGRAPYPIAITSIDLANATQQQDVLQTAYFLQQKLVLEWQINRTLKSIA